MVPYQTAIYSLSYRLLIDREKAMNVAQGAFAKAYSSLPQFRGGAFSSWLFFCNLWIQPGQNAASDTDLKTWRVQKNKLSKETPRFYP